MGFFASLAGVIRVAALAALAALCAAGASAETIPGPPIGASASERAGEFCSLRGSGSTSGNAVAFAAGVAIVAIAARRRGGDADA